MNDTEMLLRETLQDESRMLVPPRDLSQWVGEAVRRQRRARAGAASGCMLAVAVAALSIALPLRDDGSAPAPQNLAAGASATPATSSELGTVTLPAKAQESVQECLSRAEPVREGDLLARVNVGDQTWVLAGVARDGLVSYAMFSQGTRQPDLLTVSCGGQEQLDRAVVLTHLRREGAPPLENVVFGRAPAGTETVVLSGEGRRTQRVTTHKAGETWNNHVFFGAPWDGRGGTTATAFDASGNTLGTTREDWDPWDPAA